MRASRRVVILPTIVFRSFLRFRRGIFAPPCHFNGIIAIRSFFRSTGVTAHLVAKPVPREYSDGTAYTPHFVTIPLSTDLGPSLRLLRKTSVPRRSLKVFKEGLKNRAHGSRLLTSRNSRHHRYSVSTQATPWLSVHLRHSGVRWIYSDYASISRSWMILSTRLKFFIIIFTDELCSLMFLLSSAQTYFATR